MEPPSEASQSLQATAGSVWGELAMTVSFSALAVVSGVVFKRGKWKAKVV